MRPAATLGRVGFLLLATLGGPHFSKTVSAQATQSDPAAVKAMRNVIGQSGGADAWKRIRSAEESFSVLGKDDKTPHVIRLLDDWSSNTTRYRRGLQGKTGHPMDHNGTSTFSLNTGASQVEVPEFDQARTLVPRFPAAAAEVMLRRTEYVLRISSTQICKSGDICVDVFRAHGSTLPSTPEQQWKISSTTGLPTTVRYQIETVGPHPGIVWREVYFLKYDSEDGLTIPVSIVVSLRGRREFWRFTSMKQNPGFDTSKFDREVAQ